MDVDALEAARAAATARPWSFYEPRLPELFHSADAALVTAAVTNLPDLLAAVRERDALRAGVEGLAEEYDANGGWDLDYSARLRALLAAVDGGQ